MDNKQLAMVKAAQALRKVAAENEALKSDADTYQDCLSIAFDMASEGRIENDKDAILQKTSELMTDKNDISGYKKYREMDMKHSEIGSVVEKRASSSSDDLGDLEYNFMQRLSEIF